MVIKGAMLCDANGEFRGDVRFKEGKITAVSRSLTLESGEEVFEANGLVLMPGCIDLYSQIASISRENLIELSQKAATGGITQIALMGGIYNALGLELISALKDSLKAEILGIVDAISADKNALNELAILVKKGAKGFFVNSSSCGNLLRRVCEFSLMFNKPIFFNCEDSNLSANGVMNDGELSARLGLPGILPLSETKEVAQISEVARFMGIKAVFLAIATKRSVEIIKEANIALNSENLSVQTSIHHLLLTEDLCNNYNTAAKIKPPLKSESTRASLLNSVKNGEISLITALQSQKSLAQKDLSFEEAAFGVDMVEHFLPICYTLLVKNMRLGLKDLSRILSFNPACVLGMESKGLIAPGFDADFVIFNPKATQIIENADSPYYDSIFSGSVEQVFVSGKRVI